MHLIATFNDSALSTFAQRLGTLGSEGAADLSAELNAAGEEIRHNTVRAETAQTGLRQATLERAQHAHPSSRNDLRFVITSSGGDINLRYFGAREVGGGVTAHPLGNQTFYGGAFITSGRSGNRRPVAKLNGQVYVNVAGGQWGGKIKKQGSGVFIPREMTQGRTAEAFQAGAAVAMDAVVTRLGGMLG